MLETHPLLHGNNLIITSPWPGLWQVHTHYCIPRVDADSVPPGGEQRGQGQGGTEVHHGPW